MAKSWKAVAVGAAFLAGMASAEAAVVTGTGSDFSVDWSLAAGAPDNDGGATSPIPLTATAAFDVTSFTGTQLVLSVTLSNTTVLSGGVTEAGIASFGIGVTPDASGVLFTDVNDGAMTSAELQTGQQNFPGGFKNIDVCVYAAGCSGGGQGSLLAVGQSDTFTLTISFDTTVSSVTLDPFPIKFQTTAGSFEFGGSEPGPVPTPVPEPATLALFGLGLAVLGASLRYRRAR